MSVLDILRRPSFKVGTETINVANQPPLTPLPERTRSVEDLIGRRPRFVPSPPKPRSVPEFDALMRQRIKREGIKVQLGPKTLAALLSVEVPDVNNPAIKIKKNIPLAQLMQTVQGQQAALHTLMTKLQNTTDMNSASARTTLAQTSAVVAAALGDIHKMSKMELEMIGRAMTLLAKHEASPQDFDIKENLITENMWNDDYSDRYMHYLLDIDHLYAPKWNNMLTTDKPVFGITGIPIKIKTLENNLKKGQILNLRQRRMYKNLLEARIAEKYAPEKSLWRPPDLAAQFEVPVWDIRGMMERAGQAPPQISSLDEDIIVNRPYPRRANELERWMTYYQQRQRLPHLSGRSGFRANSPPLAITWPQRQSSPNPFDPDEVNLNDPFNVDDSEAGTVTDFENLLQNIDASSVSSQPITSDF